MTVILNPCSLVLDDVDVSASNPLPVTSVSVTPATQVVNPRSLVLDGIDVGDTNLLPVTTV